MAQCALDIKADLSTIMSRNKTLQDIWLEDNEWEKLKYLFIIILIIKFITYLLI